MKHPHQAIKGRPQTNACTDRVKTLRSSSASFLHGQIGPGWDVQIDLEYNMTPIHSGGILVTGFT